MEGATEHTHMATLTVEQDQSIQYSHFKKESNVLSPCPVPSKELTAVFFYALEARGVQEGLGVVGRGGVTWHGAWWQIELSSASSAAPPSLPEAHRYTGTQ